jgi:hypothetical protein
MLNVESAEKPPLFGGAATPLATALSFHCQQADFSKYMRRVRMAMGLARDAAFEARGMAA